MDALMEFLSLNGLSAQNLSEAIHMDIREAIFSIVCRKLKNDPDFFTWSKKVFFSSDDINAVQKIVLRACNCKLSHDDTLWMLACIKAFFDKTSVRKVISPEIKLALLQKQHYQCAYCKSEISLDDMHVDHIIPFDYVGDELDNNYQGLCKDCNWSKTNNIAKTVINLITQNLDRR